MGTPTWTAARPIPGAAYIVSNMSATSVFSSWSNVSTGLEICRRTGSGVSKIGRMDMAFNMAGIGRFSTGGRFPKLDRIALGIVDPREAANARIVPFRLGDHLDTAF